MKRKMLLVALALVCALTCAFGLVACDNGNNDNGGTGSNGSNGGDNKPSHTHTYFTTWTRNETHHWHNCTITGCDEVSDKAEHVWDSGEVTEEPTCTTAGAKVYTCTVCDKTKTEEITATGHVFSEEWAKDDTHHWHNCTITGCEEKDGYAEHDFTNGDCGVCGKKPATKELEYTLNVDGKSYTVTGISQYVADIVIAAEYNGKPVTGIDNFAFEENTAIKSVYIPDSVTTIGDYAFYGCSSLTSVTIGNSVTTIGSSAFSGCSALTSITIPDSVTTIGNYAFYGCSALESVTIGNGITTIGYRAFDGCSSLQYYEYDNACYLGNAGNLYVVLIKPKDTSITNCTINSKTKVICSLAFSGCSNLTNIKIPDSVTTIDSSAFQNCSSLTSITIGNSVTTIGGSAFSGCSALTSITIPDSVTSIGNYAFDGCSSLKYNEYDNACYLGNASNLYVVLIKSTDTSITNCTINSKTKVICSWAFSGCSNLTSITIPDSVTTIGSSAFQNCSSLTSVTIGSNVESIGANAFHSCNSLTSVTFTNTSGWWVSSSSTATSGKNVDVTDISRNASNFTSPYYYLSYYWRRG